jgi:hypothetical protein
MLKAAVIMILDLLKHKPDCAHELYGDRWLGFAEAICTSGLKRPDSRKSKSALWLAKNNHTLRNSSRQRQSTFERAFIPESPAILFGVRATLVINEIYLSLQGEIPAGLPCIFIRLTACDLRCLYDTAYAFTEGMKRSLEEIQTEVNRLGAPFREKQNCRWLN